MFNANWGNCYGVATGGMPTTSRAMSMTINFQQSTSAAVAPNECKAAENPPTAVKRKRQRKPKIQPSGQNPSQLANSTLCEVCQKPGAKGVKERQIFGKKYACESCTNDVGRLAKMPPEDLFKNKCGGHCDMAKVRELFKTVKNKKEIPQCCRWKHYLEMGFDETELNEEARWITVFGFSKDILDHQILNYFEERYGRITASRRRKQVKNGMDICFSLASEKRKAFASNGCVFEQHIIGVLHCDRPTDMNIEMRGRDGSAEEEELDDEDEEESYEQRQPSSSSAEMGWNRQSSSSTAEMGYNMNKSAADILGDEETAREIEEVRLLAEKIEIAKTEKAGEYTPSKDLPTALQHQQQKLTCHVCCATVDEVNITHNEAFNGKPVCYKCCRFIYDRRYKYKMEEIAKEKCKCPNEDKSEEQLHEICRENPKDRAGFKSIGVKCTCCALRLFKWVGFDAAKIASPMFPKQQQQQQPACCVFCSTPQVIFTRVFSRKPICKNCLNVINYMRRKTEGTVKDECACPNKDKSGEELLEICRTDRAGIKSIARRCVTCAERLYTWIGLGTKQTSIQDDIVHYEEAIKKEPTNAEAHINLASIFEAQGRSHEAILHYKEAIKIEPTNAEAHKKLALILEDQGPIQEAIYHYEEAIKIEPTNAEAHNNLAILLGKHGKIEQAKELFLKALEIDPNLESAQKNLANF